MIDILCNQDLVILLYLYNEPGGNMKIYSPFQYVFIFSCFLFIIQIVIVDKFKKSKKNVFF